MYVDLNEDDPMDLKDDPKDRKEDPKDLEFRGFNSDDEVSDVADMYPNEKEKDDPIDLSVPFPADMNRLNSGNLPPYEVKSLIKDNYQDLKNDPKDLKDDPKDLKDDPKDLKDDQDRYSCKLCAKTFKYLKNFQNHEESRECENACEYCGKKLTSKKALKKHEMIHTGEKPFSCNTCGKSFININSMKRHELIHTGEKPYSCQYCKNKFRHTASLKQHERIHLGLLKNEL